MSIELELEKYKISREFASTIIGNRYDELVEDRISSLIFEHPIYGQGILVTQGQGPVIAYNEYFKIT